MDEIRNKNYNKRGGASMLVKLSVGNFKSFDDVTELTMVSSNKIRMNIDHKVKIKGTSLLKHAVIYGANASGKTNLILFFKFFKECVCQGIPVESSQYFCKTKKENKKKESHFELQITVGDKFYAYGFSIILNERKITGEWLYELYQNGSAKCLFECDVLNGPVLNRNIKLTEVEKRKFQTYADDFKGNDTSLFLTEMNRGKKYDNASKLIFFQDVFDWIKNQLIIITPDMPLIDLKYYSYPNSLEIVNKLIKTFDAGIQEIKFRRISLEELKNSISNHLFQKIKNYIKDKRIEEKEASFVITMRSKNMLFNVYVEKNNEPIINVMKLNHEQSFYEFDFEEESEGTKRIFDLMEMILNKNDDVLYIVDELEQSLHPQLTSRFLKLFMEQHKYHQVQLLFTTHESTIMDQNIFRRDEIWFVERNNRGESSIYSLDRFKERYDKVLSKAYLEGRYGAIPVFSEFSKEG